MSEEEAIDPKNSVAKFVHARVNSIQNDYLSATNKSRGARKLATLRHASTMPIGSNVDAWPLEFEGLPLELVGKGPDPSPGENAVHAALTLYALHQQGQSRPMHANGRGFGGAVRQLVLQGKEHYSNLEIGEMPRRFRAFITAESMEETLHYARQIVQQLRGAAISLDYAKFAVQLYDLQNPYREDRVRLAWGREYASTSVSEADESN